MWWDFSTTRTKILLLSLLVKKMLKIGENLAKLQARKCICLTHFVRLGSVQVKAEEFVKHLEYNEK